jgi:GH15 family glucan-1,4-alpha-glucosidase
MGSNHIRYEGLAEPVRLTTNASLTYILEEKDFVLSDDLYFVLSWGIPLEGSLETTFEEFLSRTVKYWETWVQHCHLPHLFQKEVIRSALVLKLHQYEDTGAIIASCTTSLPEIPQEGRNWDYRLCWLRDTFYTLSALSAIGQFEEMEKYANFIENLNLNESSVFQPVYRIDGSSEMKEHTLPLAGYLGNQPVRIGNEAAMQVQNDAYGQVLLALYKLFSDERLLMKRQRNPVALMTNVLNFIEKNMNEPDNGVWEFRGRKLVHTYTLLFHWAGCMAVRKIARLRNNSTLVERAELCLKKVSALMESCYDPQKKAYTHAVGGTDLDASLLQMISLGYLEDSEKARAHFLAIEKELMIAPGLLLRYRHDDDFGKQQSAFLVCSFWYIEAMAHLGRAQEAKELLTALVEKTQNHVGLMSEDYDTKTESQWGNFPQTYSHVGLINCAFAIDKAIKNPPFA